jgi:exodeoxyribonuclease VII large subunit
VEKILRVLGPEATLGRGYSITTDVEGNLVRSISAIHPKMKIRTRVSDGEFDSKVV